MKKSLIGVSLLIFGLLQVAGCGEVRKEDQGAVVGAVIGGVIGSKVGKGRGRTAAIIVGAIAGSMIGRKLGRQFDEYDRERVGHVFEHNKTGYASSWDNPDTGYRYTAMPTHTYEASSGEPCREFNLDATIEGRTEKIYGTACRQKDGSWEIIR